MEKSCGCKGIRSCRLCEPSNDALKQDDTIIYHDLLYCIACRRAFWPSSTHYHVCGQGFPLENVKVFEDFVSQEEELSLVEQMEQEVWSLSQSGRLKQDFGPKVNFKKKKVKLASFNGLPNYSRPLVQRINQLLAKDFRPVELCNLNYTPERGAAITPHLDDAWLWGERLITINLLSSTNLRFSLPNSNEKLRAEICHFLHSMQWPLPEANKVIRVAVPLPRRSLVVVEGAARHIWLHEVTREDITERRIAMTFRELSLEFQDPAKGAKEDLEMGRLLLQTASSFQGVSIAQQTAKSQ